MANYAFIQPVQPGKIDTWKQYIAEMTGPRRAAVEASRKRIGLSKEVVWLQHMPTGDYAVVYFEAPDIGKVFQGFLTSTDPFDVWFREKVLMEIHGMNPAGPMPPMNQPIFNAP